MRKCLLHALFCIWCLLALLAQQARAKSPDFASPTLTMDDSAYADLDRLAAHGLIPDRIIGLRPLPRSEVARLILQARSSFTQAFANRVSAKRSSVINTIIENLEGRFGADLARALGTAPAIQFNALRTIYWSGSYLSSPSRPYFSGSGSIIASTTPLVSFNGGRHVPQGLGHALETEHEIFATHHFAANLRPRFQLEILNNQRATENAVYLQEGSLSLALANTQLDVGRGSLVWGQSDQGGVLFSTHARPLDMVRLGNPRPWKMPVVGGLQYSFFFGTLGPEQFYKNPYISGIKVALRPHRSLEIGIARALIFGGSGAPEMDFFNSFKEYFGIRGNHTSNVTNSITGFETRLTFAALRYSSLYGELYFDDFSFFSIPRRVVQDSGILVGVNIPRLNDTGTLGMRIEGRKFSAILYEHGIWVDGWTENGLVLGDPLGPDAESLRIQFTKTWPMKGLRLTTNFYLERMDSDTIGYSTAEGRFVLINGTSEWRVRNRADLDYDCRKWLTTGISVAHEYAHNFGFVSGDARNDVAIRARITINPGARFIRESRRP